MRNLIKSLQWYAGVVEDLKGKLTLGAISAREYYEKLAEALETAMKQEKEDMFKLLESEIRSAFIHGQSNGKMIKDGLERDEVEDYTNSRMIKLKTNKNNK